MTTDDERLAAHRARRGPTKASEAAKTYRQQLGFDRLHDILLNDLFRAYKPGGSGPLSEMLIICALIEEIRDLRNEMTQTVLNERTVR